jgi:hypothetical protein
MQRFLMAMILAALPSVSAGCTFLAPFAMDQIGAAEIVVVGRVTGYETLQVEGAGAALVTVVVDEVLKGGAEGEMTFVWNSGMAQGPHESRAKGRVLVGAMKGGRTVNPMSPDARPDLPSVIQPYCGEVWMQPALSATVKAARKALE